MSRQGENTPFLNSETDEIPSYTRDYSRVPEESSNLDIHEVDEQDVLTYIQQRRASIASVGADEFPNAFNSFTPIGHPHAYHVQPHDQGLSSGHGLGPSITRKSSRTMGDDRLSVIRSNQSFIDVQDVISTSHLANEPETDTKTELKVLVKYSIPLIVAFLLQYSLTVASVFSVGRLGSNELAAVSLASMTSNISGYAIVQGVSTCLDTLCAQSYGRKDYQLVGVHFMRCNYLLLLVFIPIFVLWFFLSENILLLIIANEPATGLNSSLAYNVLKLYTRDTHEDNLYLCKLAGQYLKILGFGLPGFILFENGKHFLQSQGIFHASTYVLAICAPLNVVLNYLLVWNKYIGIGFIGAPLSVMITNYLMLTLLYCYIFFVNGYQCLPKNIILDKAYFKNWSKMINLSVPGVLMVEAEWLAFEIITFTASKFGTTVLAAQSVVSTTCVLLYQIPFGISIASSTRIAWFVGAASKRSAKTTTNATIIVAVAVGVINGLFLFFNRESLVRLYTKEEAVIKLAKKVLIIGAVYQVNDSLSCLTSGILRGQGRQRIGGYLNLFSYYFIALPLAFYLSFNKNLQLLGLWLGMLIALVTLSILQLYFVMFCDWDFIINECINEGILEENGSINPNFDAHSIVPSMSSSHIF